MPLLKVARSVPVWALQFSLVGFYWVIYTIVTLSPLYYDTVYGMPVDLVRLFLEINRKAPISAFGRKFRFRQVPKCFGKNCPFCRNNFSAERVYFGRNSLLSVTFGTISGLFCDRFQPKEGYFVRDNFFRFLLTLSVAFRFLSAFGRN